LLAGVVALVVLPLVVCLAVGAGFVAAGFAAVHRIRAAVRRGGGRVERLERLMVNFTLTLTLDNLTLCCMGPMTLAPG